MRRGEIFGFLGPERRREDDDDQDAHRPHRAVRRRGVSLRQRVPSPEAQAEVGFLPENPYVYPYLTPREFVELCGRLSGLGGDALRERAAEMSSIA